MRWPSMRNFVPLILAIAGIVVMVAASCDYVANVNDFDTYIFIAGLALLVLGYVLTMKAAREAVPAEEISARRKRKGE